jgi:RNA polymerase sigma-70 factor (ECF subfamily)
MAPPAGHVVKHLRELLRDGAAVRDGELLSAFAAERDEDAFAALVQRHGPMVFGLCRRILHDPHDAEDAFQATFLVLARRAGAVRKPDAVASWLHGVALRLARKLKCQAALRRRLERQAAPPGGTMPAEASWQEVLASLDEELARLPDKQRLPLVLCYLEGLTQEDAAARLGWPRGTLKRRLETGRETLQGRLRRRGVAPAAVLLATLPAADTLAAQVPVPAAALARTAATFAARQALPAGAVAPHVLALAEGVLRTMLIAKLRLVLVAALVFGLSAGGALLFAASRPVENAESAPQNTVNPQPPARDPAGDKQPPPKDADKKDLDRFQGDWIVADVVSAGEKKPANGQRFQFTGGRVKLHTRGAEFGGAFQLRPGEIDVDWDDRGGNTFVPFEGKVLGIYKFDGDTLVLCLGAGDGLPDARSKSVRPKQFSAKQGESTILFVLKRPDPAPKQDPNGNTGNGNAGKKQVKLGESWRGPLSKEDEGRRVVVRDKKGLEELWTKISKEPAPQIDFEKDMVLAVFLGKRLTAGHDVQITRVEATADGWTVYVREKEPSPNTFVPQEVTRPFHVVVVPRFEGKVTFVTER